MCDLQDHRATAVLCRLHFTPYTQSFTDTEISVHSPKEDSTDHNALLRKTCCTLSSVSAKCFFTSKKINVFFCCYAITDMIRLQRKKETRQDARVHKRKKKVINLVSITTRRSAYLFLCCV